MQYPRPEIDDAGGGNRWITDARRVGDQHQARKNHQILNRVGMRFLQTL